MSVYVSRPSAFTPSTLRARSRSMKFLNSALSKNSGEFSSYSSDMRCAISWHCDSSTSWLMRPLPDFSSTAITR